MAWDAYLAKLLNGFSGQWESVDSIIIFVATFLLPIMGVLMILAAFTAKRLKEEHWYDMPVKAFVAALFGYVIRFGIGEIVGRARPFVQFSDINQLVPMDTLYDSFPSGHATIAFAIAFVIWRIDRDWGIAFLFLALFVALGRVFAGLHFPIDIIGGAIVGWAGAWIVFRIEHVQWNKLERRLKHR